MHNNNLPPIAPKPYPNLIKAVADGLDEIFSQQYFADKVVSHLLKRDKRWGARDRAFIAETVYDCVRWYRLLTYLADSDNSLKVISAYWIWKYDTVLESKGVSPLPKEDVYARYQVAKTKRALKESIPDWIDDLGMKELPEQWPKLISSMNQQAEVFLRANTLKIQREDLIHELAKENIEATVDTRAPNALKVAKRKNFWITKAYKSGFFEVQDIASQQIAPLLDVQPGMTVIDTCAGAGGKTLQLAASMKNKGRLIALDINAYKLGELKKRARRAGISNLDIRLIENTKVIKRLKNKADRLLMDAPCSGLGVLRRNPDSKWKLSPEFVAEIKTWQADILDRYPSMLKSSGKGVYATCSILPSENFEQVEKFLNKYNNYKLEQELTRTPIDGFDGFYAALFHKTVE